MTEAYCNRLLERGYEAGVYLSYNFWRNWYGDDYFEKHPDFYIWYARPDYAKPDRDCYLWQYASNDGTEYGADEPLDKNILFGEYISNYRPAGCEECEKLKAEVEQLAELLTLQAKRRNEEKGVLKETIASLQEKVEALAKENEQLKLEAEKPVKEGLLVRILKILFGGA